MTMQHKPMTREEWYNSPAHIQLRFLNNFAAGIDHKVQEFYDILELILAENPMLPVQDKFTMVEMQARIVRLEAKKLWDRCGDLARFLEIKQYTDMCRNCNNKWNDDGTCPTCSAVKPK